MDTFDQLSYTSDPCPTSGPTPENVANQASYASYASNQQAPAHARAYTQNNFGVGQVVQVGHRKNKSKTLAYGPTSSPTPKTTSVGRPLLLKRVRMIGAGNKSMQAAAASFAQLPDAGYWMLRMMGGDQLAVRYVGAWVMAELARREVKPSRLPMVAVVVMRELQSPITERPWSYRTRAAIAGIAATTWQRHCLCAHVSHCIDQLLAALCQAEQRTTDQITLTVDVGQN